MKQVADFQEYQTFIETYRRKGVRSNDYIQQSAKSLISCGKLFVDAGLNNAFIFVKKDIGMRLYYYINDLEEQFDFRSYKNMVVEILFRNDPPKDEIEFLKKNGFCENLVRDQYACMYRDFSCNVKKNLNTDVCIASTLEQVKMACELFNSTFDVLSGDFIPESSYESLLNSRSILVALEKDSKSFLGALHQIKEGLVNVIGHVAVSSAVRNHGVGKALVSSFIERNMESEKTRYQLWVQRQNEIAVNMYKGFGFKFLNKSTISLIK